MNALDLAWHLLNFAAPSVLLGTVTVLLAKLAWHRELRAVTWQRLWLFAVGAAMTVALLGLVLTQRDGKLATYAGMVLACAIATFVAGFVRRSR